LRQAARLHEKTANGVNPEFARAVDSPILSSIQERASAKRSRLGLLLMDANASALWRSRGGRRARARARLLTLRRRINDESPMGKPVAGRTNGTQA